MTTEAHGQYPVSDQPPKTSPSDVPYIIRTTKPAMYK